jgi:hypothetical protein
MQRIIAFLQAHKTASILVAALVVLGVIGGIGYAVFSRGEGNVQQTRVTDSGKKEVARRLDGVLVAPELANAQPIAIVVENHTAARPQSGLDKARVVYEALAEGGITRFLGIFDTTEPIDEIGPVRSARPYFNDLAEEYGAVYGHVGGSPQALAEVQSGTRNLTDFNQFYNGQYFWRSTDRGAPHNVYTSTELLTFALRDMERTDASGDFAPWTFAKAEEKEGDRGADGQEISINYSTFSYKTRYVYDRAANAYARYHSDDAHVMKDGARIAPKNVVVQYVQTSVIAEGRLSMITSGEGMALVFSNGNVTEGTWKKENGRTRFYDAADEEVELAPGQTWVEVVPQDREVLYPKVEAPAAE